jgi:hypothetical protein
MYYRITRWLFGNEYIPFATSEKEEEIHPISLFVMDNYESIELLFTILPNITPLMLIVTVTDLTQQTFLYITYYYLKMKRDITK